MAVLQVQCRSPLWVGARHRQPLSMRLSATATATSAGEAPVASAAASYLGQTALKALNALRCSTSSTCTKQVIRICSASRPYPAETATLFPRTREPPRVLTVGGARLSLCSLAVAQRRLCTQLLVRSPSIWTTPRPWGSLSSVHAASTRRSMRSRRRRAAVLPSRTQSISWQPERPGSGCTKVPARAHNLAKLVGGIQGERCGSTRPQEVQAQHKLQAD